MNEQEKTKYFNDFNNGLHRLGRFTLIMGIILLIAVPFMIAMLNEVSPDVKGCLSGFAKVGMIYIPVAIVEFLVYSPMLGVGGSYLSFLTGNITNMKIPCVMNSQDIAETKAGTPENEIVATLSVATSAIVTMLVIVAGVVLLVPLQPILQNEALLPAFNNVVPALFGALGFKYFSKSLTLSGLPLMVMSALCIFVPAAIDQTSLLMLPSGALSLLIGYFLYKSDRL